MGCSNLGSVFQVRQFYGIVYLLTEYLSYSILKFELLILTLWSYCLASRLRSNLQLESDSALSSALGFRNRSWLRLWTWRISGSCWLAQSKRKHQSSQHGEGGQIIATRFCNKKIEKFTPKTLLFEGQHGKWLKCISL